MVKPRVESIESVESNLARLAALVPELPKNEVMIARLVKLLAHEIGLILEHKIRPFGLGEGEFRVLMALFSQPNGTAHPGDLCARASQKPANMSRISDALVERGLITRVPSDKDRRKLVLRITEKGVALVRRALPAVCAPLRELCSPHSAREQQRLIAELKEMLIRLNAMTGSWTSGQGS